MDELTCPEEIQPNVGKRELCLALARSKCQIPSVPLLVTIFWYRNAINKKNKNVILYKLMRLLE
jgi:hypothetical protein